MVRPTSEVTTESGIKLVVNDYITGAENWQIQNIYIRAMGAPEGSELKVTVGQEAEEAGLKLAIVSINANTDIIPAIKALPLIQYREVIEAVKPVLDPKKKSETP
jgi:hypothetical protein